MHVKKLSVSIDGSLVLRGVDLSIDYGCAVLLMGPNGSGKSTLVQVIAGNPAYEVVGGDIVFDGQSLLSLGPDGRARLGIFASFQHPPEVPGVNVASYLRMIYNKRLAGSNLQVGNVDSYLTSPMLGDDAGEHGATSGVLRQGKNDAYQDGQSVSPVKFRALLKEKLEILDIKSEFLDRHLNEGFSGGEKRKMELLQMLVLEPRLAILDEIDSGLDVDALKCVGGAINYLRRQNPETAFLIVTHHARILDYIRPDFVHVMKAGKIVKSGGFELARELERTGYKEFGEESFVGQSGARGAGVNTNSYGADNDPNKGDVATLTNLP